MSKVFQYLTLFFSFLILEYCIQYLAENFSLRGSLYTGMAYDTTTYIATVLIFNLLITSILLLWSFSKKKPVTLIKKMFLIFFLAAVFPYLLDVSIFLIKKHSENHQISRLEFTEKYENGWFGFSFLYPQGAVLEDEKSYNKIDVHVNDVHMRPLKGTSVGCFITVTPLNNPWTKHDFDNSTMIKGWSKKGNDWEKLHNNLRYQLLSNEWNNACDKVVESFTFTSQFTTQRAGEATRVKQVAEKYAVIQYPKKVFYNGVFVEEFIADEEHASNAHFNGITSDPTNDAIVIFGLKEGITNNRIYEKDFEGEYDLTAIHLKRINEQWIVDKEFHSPSMYEYR